MINLGYLGMKLRSSWDVIPSSSQLDQPSKRGIDILRLVRNAAAPMIVQYVNYISRTCGSVRSSLSAPVRLVTDGSEAAETISRYPSGCTDDREELCETASVKGGLRDRLDDKSNPGELFEVPLI